MGIIRWRLQRQNILPIINAIGDSDIKEAEFSMIQMAISLIEKANQFGGIPYMQNNCMQCNSAIAISFSLIFPSEEKINSYIQSIKPIL